jgi:hypothetical protein
MKKTIILLLVLLFTASLAFGADLNESFESGIPADWTVINNDGGTYTWGAYDVGTEAYDGDYVAHQHWETPCDDWLITPKLIPSAGHNNLSFWYMSSSSSWLEDFNVKLSTTGTNVADFTVDLGSITDAPNAWTEFTYDLSSYNGQEIYIAVQCVSDDDFYLYVDYFTGVELYVPAYPKPTDLETTNITQTTADLGWTEAGTATTWEVEWGETGFTQGEGTTITGITSNPYTLNPPLTAGTTYDWYVRSDYGDGNYSDWAGPATFSTLVGPVTSYPYTQDFDGTWGGSPAAPTGWTVINNDADSYTWSQSAQYITPHSGDYVAHGMGNADDYLITPPLDLTGKFNARLKWWDVVESATRNNTYDVLVSTTTNEISAFTDNLGTYDCTNITWTEHILDLSAYDGENIYIAFHQTYSAATNWGFGIDDVKIEEIPTNPIFAIDPESKDFGTVIAGNSSAPQTFTITNEGGGTLTINDGDITITGTDAADFVLSNEPTYPVELGANESAAVDVSFSPTSEGSKTANLTIVDNRGTTDIPLNGEALPAGYVFEGFETAVPPAGWDVINTQNNDWTTDSYNQYEGEGCARLSYYYSYPSYLSSISTLVTPKLDLDGTQTLYFFAKQSTAGQTLKIQYSSDGVAFTDLETITLTTDWQEFQVDLSGSKLTGEYYLGFYGETTAEYAYIYLDNVYHPAAVPMPPAAPTNPSPADDATAVLENADLTWTNGYGTETVDVYFGTDETAVTNKEASVKVVDNLNVETYDPGTMTYSTEYFWRVVCKNSAKAEIDGPVWSFTTQENPNYGGGGTTQGGYYFANSLASGAPSAPTYSWIDISTTGTDVSGDVAADSDVGGPYELGFTFNYFGVDYTQFYICADGYISLVEETSSTFTNTEIPNAGNPNGMIALLWDDMDPGDTSVTDYHLYYGTASGKMVITYEKMPEYGADADGWFTAQAILYSNGNIKLQYKEVGASFDLTSCTVGIENAAGDAGVNYLYNGTGGPIFSDGKAGEIAIMFGEDESSLPVVLSEFTATFDVESGLPVLNWVTQSEDNNSGWNVYRGNYREAFNEGNANQINPQLVLGAGTTSQPSHYSFQDPYGLELIPGNIYWYFLESVDNSGESYLMGSLSLQVPEDVGEPPLPTKTTLIGNYPNPFNPVTNINFNIKENETGTLSIYNVKGQVVLTKQFEAGEHKYVWDSENNASGVYFYKLETNSYSKIKKMLMLK